VRPLPPAPASFLDAGDPVGRRETWIGAAFIVATFLLRLVYAYQYRFDSDEPQHLHVVWAWSQGLLPYRDLFDNHAPLFHLLCVPLLSVAGEHASALYVMRIGMFPIYAVVLLCVYQLGRTLFDARTALWAAVLAGLWPQDFLTSIEFRTDDLWAALWMLGIATVSCGGWTRRRSLAVGLLFGAAFGVSMKTSLLVAAFAGAALATQFLAGREASIRGTEPDLPGAGENAARAGLFVGGLLFTPAVLAVYLAARGALARAVYCTIGHNLLPGLGLWQGFPARALLFAASLPVLWMGANAVMSAGARLEIARRRTFVFLAASLYLVILLAFWPLITAQDFLPFIPLAVLLASALLLAVVRAVEPRWARVAWAVVVAVALGGELVGLGIDAPPWQNATRSQTRMVADVLQLTEPSEYVMDLKGEAVFRPRSFYWVLEDVTEERMRRGIIPDRIPERLIETHTAVVATDSARFPARAREFMNANYVPVSDVRVLGRFLTAGADRPRKVTFMVNIPDRYAFVTPEGPARGWLDGQPYTRPRFLARGTHAFQALDAREPLALVWARAVERGFSPFSRRVLSP
jgi:hypothetical protein